MAEKKNEGRTVGTTACDDRRAALLPATQRRAHWGGGGKDKKGKFVRREFVFENWDRLTSRTFGTRGDPEYEKSVHAWIERVVIMGLKDSGRVVRVTTDGGGRELEFECGKEGEGVCVVKMPGWMVRDDFEMRILYG